MKINQLIPIVVGRCTTALFTSSALMLFTAGCANMVTTATNVETAQGATVGGQVHGGNNPVGFATVQLYTVGTTGVGSSGTLLATATTSAGGNFSFTQQTSGTFPNTGSTYVCPSSGTAVLYLIVKGGNTTGSGGSGINNSAAVFLAPLGLCSSVSSSTFVNISEVTTAAMLAATAQFINPTTEQIGNDGIGVAYQAILNAFNTVSNLVNPATGLAYTSRTLPAASGGYQVSGVSTTATPESAKLNTIANILSACINQTSASSGTACSTLFANATPPTAAYTSQPSASFPTATDTLQAGMYMFLNPTDTNTSNRTNLFNLSPASGAPFQPAIGTLPTDWSVAISYSSSSTCGTSSGFLSHPYDIGLDLAGNVWISNAAGSNGALVELSSSGVPQSCVTLGGSGKSTVVDTAGNIWYGDSVGNLYRFTPSTNAVRTYTSGTSTPLGPLALTADGAGNIYFTSLAGTTGSLYYIQNGATASGVNSPVQISAAVGPNPARIFPDSSGNIWSTTGSSSIVQIAAGSSAGAGQTYLNGYVSTPFTVPSPSSNVNSGSLANRNIYITSQDAGSTLYVLTPSNGSYISQSGFPTAANTGGLNSPTGLWLDGAQNIFSGNGVAQTSGQFAVAAVAANGTGLSANGTNGGFQKAASYFNTIRQSIVDSAGNVWVTNDNNPNSVTQIVGAAVPIVQPFSYGLQSGRFQTIP